MTVVANWKNSLAFYAFAQDVHRVGVVEVISILRMLPKFDVGFLSEVIDEQRATLVKMNTTAGTSEAPYEDHPHLLKTCLNLYFYVLTTRLILLSSKTSKFI